MHDLLKKKAAEKALDFIRDKMIVGLGTGSTANYFIDGLAERKLNIKVVASSNESERRAKKGGLNVLDINDVTNIDVVVDGADEIDFQKRLLKGAGGALFKEKILAVNAKKMVVIADESKLVKSLGHKPLPVEISCFGYKFTKNTLEKMGYKSALRLKEGKPFISENNNYILDVVLQDIKNFEDLQLQLLVVPGVIETGLFLNFNPLIIIANSSRGIEIIE